jgi:hypothetical protein
MAPSPNMLSDGDVSNASSHSIAASERLPATDHGKAAGLALSRPVEYFERFSRVLVGLRSGGGRICEKTTRD